MALRFDGRALSLLLKIHVWTVTLGFGGTFLLGAIGICFVCQRCISDFSQPRLEALKRVSFIFNSLAAILTAVGIGLGMLWAKAAWGRYWAWDPKETGAFCILAWLIFSTVIHCWRGLSARVVFLLSLIGNVVVGRSHRNSPVAKPAWRSFPREIQEAPRANAASPRNADGNELS